MDPQVTGKNQQSVLTGQVPVRPKPKPEAETDEEIEEAEE